MRWLRTVALVSMTGCPECEDDEDHGYGSASDAFPPADGCFIGTTEVDAFADGTIDLVIERTYDERGLLVRTVTDVPPYADDIIQSEVVYTYDDRRRVVKEVSTYYAAGMEFVSVTTNSYDQNGDLGLMEIDANADGAIDLTAMRTYDGSHHLLAEEVFGGPDDILLERTLFTYSDDGDLVQVERDQLGDGTIDERTVHTIDDGLRAQTEIHLPADGPVTTRITYAYNTASELLETVTLDVASGYVTRETYSHDGRGNQVGSTYDAGDDGALEQSTTSEWTCP